MAVAVFKWLLPGFVTEFLLGILKMNMFLDSNLNPTSVVEKVISKLFGVGCLIPISVVLSKLFDVDCLIGGRWAAGHWRPGP